MNVPAPEISESSEMSAVAKEPAKLEAIASELFGAFTIEHRTDPETGSSPTSVFTVTARGEPRELVERRLEWYRRTQSALRAASSRVQRVVDVAL